MRGFSAAISRLGDTVAVLEKTEVDTNEFNNPEWEWQEVRTVRCLATYPDDQDQVDSRAGQYHRDSPLLAFHRGEEPGPDDRVRFEDGVHEGKTFEMLAPTPYESHVEFGAQIVNE